MYYDTDHRVMDNLATSLVTRNLGNPSFNGASLLKEPLEVEDLHCLKNHRREKNIIAVCSREGALIFLHCNGPESRPQILHPTIAVVE